MTEAGYTTAARTSEFAFVAQESLAIPMFSVLAQDGTACCGADLSVVEQTVALRIYQAMLFTRVLDERMVAAQRQGRISFYLTSTGEEAASVASAAALSDQDMLMAQYREQGALALRGFSSEQFMNQLFSNELDLGKGRQMPVHYGCKALHYMTVSSPLATQIPQAVGYAYGQKLAAGEHVTLCYFGEGAASEGDFHAALNFAAVLRAPVIFFCRNNGYAISTPAEEQYAGDGIAARGVGYGLQTIRVDGNDALAVYLATQKARAYAIEHCAPVLIEAMSYRLGAHSTSDDPSGYRSKDEEQKWREYDPLVRLRAWLYRQQWWSEAEDKALDESLRAEMLAAMKVAEKIPKPKLRELVTDVYDTPSVELRRQQEDLEQHLKRYPEHYPRTAGRA
ncbi:MULTISPECIES: thiamine pyrophosphate-dependent dehydrogenase E1 component subunit alpha [Corallincola]|uniref:2-oxoisovalerate dehydrogenase subunit alpha n=3 Tax=Corallincola TaxID=1775176 RepID=A0A368NJ47_9GAMM|nr:MULTISPECIES: thiamine pyrophosphate-dependent dehydrogenase E1 component subunit alpha [Corallincola]RCU50458.1 thiamine pyrophosphate-dependent dehydrogenase E1 component subunit alpha [Corallincola holothuriorum]TAA48532.1 thiamine pyrophosphate-dependent dehydrogenase E1 component subunit alpha [Corallincola spongiicola]TCI01785.1 thiamine pyrophosphate-dependent dehydrogenase E1 component subunit alpha [Corallincola luteus]